MRKKINRQAGFCCDCLLKIDSSTAYKQANGSIQKRCKRCANDRRRYLRNGIPTSEYDHWMNKAGGKCQICRSRDMVGIDLDSKNKITGVLCMKCRTVVKYYKDEGLMRGIVSYCEGPQVGDFEV